MRPVTGWIVVWLLSACLAQAQATEVAGIEIADEAHVAGQRLPLNGAGSRSKFFIKVYVGALYLPTSTTDARQAIDMPGPKRVLMHFLYDDVPAPKLVRGWEEGFRNNLDAAAFRALEGRLEHFNSLLEDMTTGDEIVFDLLPGEGVRVTVKGRDKGLVEGDDFMRALLSVWLGDDPADDGLKTAMLGLD